jgi:hypothetical protein
VGAPEIGDPVEAAHAVKGDHHPALSGASQGRIRTRGPRS